MNTCQYDSIVSRAEAEALKEIIFKRAREHAESLTEESTVSYTTSVKNDVMDLARDSFVSTGRNPFAPKMVLDEVPNKTVKSESTAKTDNPVSEQDKATYEVGFRQKTAEEIRAVVKNRSIETNQQIVASEVASGMDDARDSVSRRKSFMGALDFLNSQASIVLVQKHGKSFEALA
jgi:lysine/ornithine N-monooxygenase